MDTAGVNRKHLLQVQVLHAICAYLSSEFSILLCSDKDRQKTEQFFRDFDVSSTSSLDFLAFYMWIPYKAAPYRMNVLS